ncbi:MAG: UDP-N-acetylglucosamine 2-epimerase (non-hydrolyzing) [Desulfotomaculaceae bacterium]|nr:UDP-N-acetylglucosamine 2-epimerase (non-hydrolyzing) [Desulfotomaculaceae bacterium]
MLKIMAVFGTRPEAIKMAPLVQELKKYPDEIDCKVVVTAQHREMLDQVLGLFKISPDHDLDIMRPNQNLFDITSRALSGLQAVFQSERPGLVLVHGDTTTTFTAALAAYYLQIPVGHVEAGLRTYDKFSPFPEEINRHLTGVLADLHFAPTPTARRNLLSEGISSKNIFVTGNTVIDALLATVRQGYKFTDPVLSKIDYGRRRVLLVTTHRRENLGEPMREIYQALREVVTFYQDVEVIFPVHKNPLVRDVVKEELGGLKRVHLIDPLEYQPFVNLIGCSYLVLSDSGGLQEEAPALGKPVLVLRNTTERPEAVTAGTVRLVGAAREDVASETRRLLDDRGFYSKMANAINPYGDGCASQRILQAIKFKFGISQRAVEEFYPPNLS